MTKKKTVIAIVTAVIAALLLYIVLHHNPFANQNEEMIKKIISCVILIAIYLVFILKYDKIVILPVELLQNRQLIWKLAKMILRQGMPDHISELYGLLFSR